MWFLLKWREEKRSPTTKYTEKLQRITTKAPFDRFPLLKEQQHNQDIFLLPRNVNLSTKNK